MTIPLFACEEGEALGRGPQVDLVELSSVLAKQSSSTLSDMLATQTRRGF